MAAHTHTHRHKVHHWHSRSASRSSSVKYSMTSPFTIFTISIQQIKRARRSVSVFPYRLDVHVVSVSDQNNKHSAASHRRDQDRPFHSASLLQLLLPLPDASTASCLQTVETAAKALFFFVLLSCWRITCCSIWLIVLIKLIFLAEHFCTQQANTSMRMTMKLPGHVMTPASMYSLIWRPVRLCVCLCVCVPDLNFITETFGPSDTPEAQTDCWW